MSGPVTKDFKRDKRSKALVATNHGALNKFNREKELAKTIDAQGKHINTLEKQISNMQAQINKLLEQN